MISDKSTSTASARISELEQGFLSCLSSGGHIGGFTDSANQILRSITRDMNAGLLDSDALRRVQTLVTRMMIMSSSLDRLEEDCNRIGDTLAHQARGTLDDLGASIFVPREASDRLEDQPDPFLPLRLWFLDHFSNPYPNTKEKDHFKTLYPKHTKAQLDTWFTNVRRRSGWQDLKRRYTDGSLADFLRLLEEAESEDRSPIAEDARKKIEGIKTYLREGVKEKISEEIQEIVQKGAPKTNTKRKVAPRQRRERLGQLPSTLVPNDPKNSAAFDLSQFQTSLVSSPSSLDLPQLPSTQPRYPSTFSSPTTSLRSVSGSSASSFDSLISYDSNSSFASVSPSSPPASSSLVDFDSAPTSLPPLIVPSSLPRPPQHQPVPAPAPIDNPYFFTLNNTPLLPLPDEHADIVVATSSLAGFASNGDLVV